MVDESLHQFRAFLSEQCANRNKKIMLYRNLSSFASSPKVYDEPSSLIWVEIYSGRPHQIRIHLSYIGHPLVGDPLYVAGGRPSISLPENYSERYDVENFADDGGYEKPLNALPGDCGYHLHASRLLFQHPTRDEDIQIYAPSPPMLRTPEENARIDDEF